MGDAGGIDREIEVKLRLGSFADYLKLLGFLGKVEHEEHHVNGFFDTEDGLLAGAGWALRVRSTERGGLITLKGQPAMLGAAVIREEIEVEIPRGVSNDILNLRRDVMSLTVEPVEFVRRKWGDIALAKFMQFENTRQKKTFKIDDDSLMLELDKTEFADGTIEYELELELTEESQVQNVEDRLRRLFVSLNIPFEPNHESKLQRALMKAGQV